MEGGSRKIFMQGKKKFKWKQTRKHNLAVVVYSYAKQNHGLTKNNSFKQLEFLSQIH